MPVRRYHPEIRARAAKSAKTFTIIEIPSERPRRHDPEGIMKSRSFMEKRMVETVLGERLTVAFAGAEPGLVQVPGCRSSRRSSQPSSHSDPGQAPAETLAFPRWQHVGEPVERGGDVAVERVRYLAPLRRERDGNRPPVTRHRGPGDQAAAFGPVGQPGERGLL